MDKYFKIFTALFTFLVILVLGLLLLSAVKIPGLDFSIRSVQTGSMEPAIPTGSIVVTRPAQAYAVGDIITFSRRDSGLDAPVTHRISAIRLEEGVMYFTTRGDANSVEDFNEVSESEVLGKVAFSIPMLGFLLNAVRTPYGFLALIIIPAILVIRDEVKKIRREIKKNNDPDPEIT